MPKNIDIFNECTAIIFAKLYDGFPNTTELDPGRLSHSLHLEKDLTDDEFSEGFRLNEIMENTIWWLGKTGYIDWNGVSSGPIFESVVLTEKGLETMKSTPSSLSKGKRGKNQ